MQYSQKTAALESLFNKVAAGFFPVNIAKCLRTPVLLNFYECRDFACDFTKVAFNILRSPWGGRERLYFKMRKYANRLEGVVSMRKSTHSFLKLWNYSISCLQQLPDLPITITFKDNNKNFLVPNSFYF